MIFARKGLRHRKQRVVYNRLNRAHPDAIADRLLAQLAAGGIDGFLTTITTDGIRTKPFPAGASHG